MTIFRIFKVVIYGLILIGLILVLGIFAKPMVISLIPPDLTPIRFSMGEKNKVATFEMVNAYISRGPRHTEWQKKEQVDYYREVKIEFLYPEMIPWKEYTYNNPDEDFDNHDVYPTTHMIELEMRANGGDYLKRLALDYGAHNQYDTGKTIYGLNFFKRKTEGHTEQEISYYLHLNREYYRLRTERGPAYLITCINERYMQSVSPGNSGLCRVETDYNERIGLTYRFYKDLLKDWREIDDAVRALVDGFIVPTVVNEEVEGKNT